MPEVDHQETFISASTSRGDKIVETETSKSIEMSVDNEANLENPEPLNADGGNIYPMQLHARNGWVDKGMDTTPRSMKFLGFLMK
jgi:hypothetical protein